MSRIDTAIRGAAAASPSPEPRTCLCRCTMWREVQRDETMSAKEDKNARSRKATGMARTDSDNRKEDAHGQRRIGRADVHRS